MLVLLPEAAENEPKEELEDLLEEYPDEEEEEEEDHDISLSLSLERGYLTRLNLSLSNSFLESKSVGLSTPEEDNIPNSFKASSSSLTKSIDSSSSSGTSVMVLPAPPVS